MYMNNYSYLFDSLVKYPGLMQLLDPSLRRDAFFMGQAAIYNPVLFSFAAPELLDDANTVFIIGQYQPNIIMYMGFRLKNDPDFLYEFVSRYPQAMSVLEMVNPHCYYDSRFVSAVYQRNPKVAEFVSEDYKKNYFEPLKNDIVTRNMDLIQGIVATYNNIVNNVYTSDIEKAINNGPVGNNAISSLSDYYSAIFENFTDRLSDDDKKTFLDYEVDGKKVRDYLEYGESYTTAALIAERIKKGDDPTPLFIAEEDDLYGIDLMKEQYAKFGLTDEILEPYRKKGPVPPPTRDDPPETDPPAKDDDDDLEDLTADDIELPERPEKNYPSYSLSQMVVANIAGLIGNVQDEYMKRHNISSLIEPLMQQIKYYRTYIPNFDIMLNRTMLNGKSALSVLESLERTQLTIIFDEMKKVVKNKGTKKADRNDKVDKLYNFALKMYDEHLVSEMFYSSELRNITLKRIDKRNGNRIKNASDRSLRRSDRNEVDVVVSCLKGNLEAIERRIIGRISSQDEILFLSLFNQICAYCKVSPEVYDKISKLKMGDKSFIERLYEVRYKFCEVHVRAIASKLAERNYDFVSNQFNYLVMNYPESMIKQCCNAYVLNFVSLKKIAYGRLTPLELDRESSRRFVNNPVEDVIKQLREINAKRENNEGIYKAFVKFLRDYSSLSDEQRHFLSASGDATIAGYSFDDCFNINYCWAMASQVNKFLKAGNQESADITLNKMLRTFPRELVERSLDVFNIQINESRRRTVDPESSDDFGRHGRRETPVPPVGEGRAPVSDTTSGPRRRRRSSGGEAVVSDSPDAVTNYMTISQMVRNLIEFIYSQSSYSEAVNDSVRNIYRNIRAISRTNPGFRSELRKPDPVTKISIMHDLRFCDCLNQMRLAIEEGNSMLDANLRIDFSDVYAECADVITRRGR